MAKRASKPAKASAVKEVGSFKIGTSGNHDTETEGLTQPEGGTPKLTKKKHSKGSTIPEPPTTRNERITENIVRDSLRALGYWSQDSDIIVEEQKSQITEVARLLRNGGKSGAGGRGCPEFIISSPSTPDFLIIFECKASVKHHESAARDKPVDFAVDGAIHYGRVLSRSYNVAAVAASGQTASSLKLSAFVFPKGVGSYTPLTNESGLAVSEIIPFDDYVRLASYDPAVAKVRHDDLMAFSRDLHDFMRDHAKLTESEKPLLVSGTLITLSNKAFAKSFGDYSPEDLQKQWLRVIREEIERPIFQTQKRMA